jgi:hypothetical protein
MLDAVLDQKLPMFVGDRQRNIAKMKRAVSSYQDGSSAYHKLIDEMRDTEARIDAMIFAISPPAAATIIESLDRDAAVGFSPNNPEIGLDEHYRQRVTDYMLGT